jgi:hypothetical protein
MVGDHGGVGGARRRPGHRCRSEHVTGIGAGTLLTVFGLAALAGVRGEGASRRAVTEG